MSQGIANVDKQIAIRAKQADKTNSPAMKKPFDEAPKPTKTAKRIVETPDGKGYKLLLEAEKKKQDTANKFEQLGPLPFSDDEDDELSLDAIASSKSKGSDKSQGSQKTAAKPGVKPSNNAMQRTSSKAVKEGELTPFHKDVLGSAGVLTTPMAKGSSAGGWTVQGSGNRQPDFCQQLTPKGIGNLLGICNPTPPNSDSDSGSPGSNKSNRFAVLQEDDKEEVSDATTDILPIGEIPETIQEGAVLTQPNSNKAPDNIQVEVTETKVEGGTTPRSNDPQPDGVVSSRGADFHKAKSE